MTRYHPLVQAEYLARLVYMLTARRVEIAKVSPTTNLHADLEVDLTAPDRGMGRWKSDSYRQWTVTFTVYTPHGHIEPRIPYDMPADQKAEETFKDDTLEWLTKSMHNVRPPTINTTPTGYLDVAADLMRMGRIDEAMKTVHENHPPTGPLAKTLAEVKRLMEQDVLNRFAQMLKDRCQHSRTRPYSHDGLRQGRIEGEEAAASMAEGFLTNWRSCGECQARCNQVEEPINRTNCPYHGAPWNAP